MKNIQIFEDFEKAQKKAQVDAGVNTKRVEYLSAEDAWTSEDNKKDWARLLEQYKKFVVTAPVRTHGRNGTAAGFVEWMVSQDYSCPSRVR